MHRNPLRIGDFRLCRLCVEGFRVWGSGYGAEVGACNFEPQLAHASTGHTALSFEIDVAEPCQWCTGDL